MTTTYDNQPLDKLDRRYDGPVYIGVASAEVGGTEAHVSIERIERRPGDTAPMWRMATKGWEARDYHIRRFLDGPWSFLLLLDADMDFPSGILERLRSHGLPCVSGHYVRRTKNRERPVIPIWYEDDPQFRWPMMPFRGTPEPGRMYRLGATGSGCWLIHREVAEAVGAMLKGEPFFADDPMTWWPYDVAAVEAGTEKLRRLRGRKDFVGSDMRLAYFIRQAGYTIWGDADAQCGHYIQYPLGMADWLAISRAQRQAFAAGTEHDLEKLRELHAAREVAHA